MDKLGANTRYSPGAASNSARKSGNGLGCIRIMGHSPGHLPAMRQSCRFYAAATTDYRKKLYLLRDVRRSAAADNLDEPGPSFCPTSPVEKWHLPMVNALQ